MKKLLGRLFFIVLIVCVLSSLVGLVVFAAPARAGAQAYTFKNVVHNGGGYIVNVIFNPSQRDLIYAKTDMGGAYRWEPATKTWTQLLNWISADDWNWTGIESIATDPVNPNNLYIAVGTYVNDWAPTNGAILRSSDKGATFTRVDMPFKMGGNMNGRGMGERLAIDPNKNNILYFGARDGNGLWKSTDFGVTWAKVTNFPDVGTFVAVPNDQWNYLRYAVGIPWVIFDKSSGVSGTATPHIYVGVATNSSGAYNIYRSTDSGATWAPVPGQPTCTGAWGATVTCTGGATWTAGAAGSYEGGGVGYLPHNAKFDSQGTLYITYNDWEGPYNGGHGDVWKYVPSTGTWTLISPVPGSSADSYYGYGALAVDMLQPGTIMVAALNSWWPQGRMWRSTNGGATWIAAWDYTSYPITSQVFTMDVSTSPWLNYNGINPQPPVPTINLGWMMEGMNIDPFDSNRMMYNGYATYNLTDWGSGTNVVIKSEAVGIEETSVVGLVSPPSGTAHLFSVELDLGGFRHDNLDAPPPVARMYTVPYNGSNNSIDFAESNPQFLVRAGYGDPAKANPENLSTAFTYDGGNTWFAGNANISGMTGGGMIAAAANASRVVWAPAGGAVSYSTDNGNSWVASTGGIPSGAYVVSDRVNPSKFYGFSGGSFYVSTDGGASFVATVTGLPTSGKIKAIPGVEGDVWLVANQMDTNNNPVAADGIYHSVNSGASFTKLTSGVTFADVIGFGMAAPGSTYPTIFTSAKIDGVRAIYRSDDTGASWVKITDPQHQYATIQSITGDPRIYGRVYFGTNGLGIVYGDISGTPSPTNTPTRTNTPTTPPVITNTPTRTNTPSTVVPTNTPTRTPTRTATGPTPTRTRTRTPTRTATGGTPVPTNTPTRTPTGIVPTNTPTRTPTIGIPTNTPTRTPTGFVPTNTPTLTPTQPTGGACSPVTSTITAPFTFDGAGTFCWQSNNLGGYVNSWNTSSVTLNGVNITNVYVPSSSYPAQIGGYWYVSYNSTVAWGHFEAK